MTTGDSSDNKHGLLLTTDVAARGLDIPNIEHVLHYQTSRTTEVRGVGAYRGGRGGTVVVAGVLRRVCGGTVSCVCVQVGVGRCK